MRRADPDCLRVLHLNTEPSWRGGEQQVFYLHEGLLRRGHASMVCGQPGAPLAKRIAEAGLGGDGRLTEMPMRGEGDVRAMVRLAGLMRRGRFDVVQMHTSHAHTLGIVAAALLGPGRRPRTAVSRRVDFSIYRHNFLGLNGLKYRHGVDGYVTVSHAIRHVLIADGIDPARITCVHSGIDPARFEIEISPAERAALRTELGAPGEGPLIGNIAWFADHKGQVYLVEAAPKILAARPDARIALIGEGELRSALETRARELGVADRVLFPGWRQDIPRCLKAIDLFVMSSHLEGLGTAVLDAMAAGTPVVATRAGGIPEIVVDGETGLLVPVRDPDALGAAVIRMIEDPQLSRDCRIAARRRVRDEFSVDAMVEGTVAVYRTLLGVQESP
jgi:glycosyltransferase involved in cell wall biosynthesis